MTTRALAAIALSLLLSACAQTPARPLPRVTAPEQVTTALEWLRTGDIGGLLLVAATLGGQPTTWLLDTGAGAHVIDSALAARLALPTQAQRRTVAIGGEQSARQVVLPTLCLQSFCTENAAAVALDLTGYRSQTGREIHGILGVPLLRTAEVRIDLKKPALTLNAYPSATPSADPPTWPQGLPTLELTLDDQIQFRVIVDTGNAGALLLFSEFVNRTRLLRSDHPLPQLTRTELGGDASVHLGRFATVSGAGWTRTEVGAALETPHRRTSPLSGRGFNGSAGTALFDHATLVLDHRNGSVQVLAETPTAPVPGGFGLVLDPSADAIAVSHVLPASPAAQNGIQAGDRLHAIDGLSVATTAEVWRALAGRTHARFRFERAGQGFEVALERAWFLPQLHPAPAARR
ncbi:MAG: aspartyl protease family protein [Thiotrichales bacterium]